MTDIKCQGTKEMRLYLMTILSKLSLRVIYYPIWVYRLTMVRTFPIFYDLHLLALSVTYRFKCSICILIFIGCGAAENVESKA